MVALGFTRAAVVRANYVVRKVDCGDGATVGRTPSPQQAADRASSGLRLRSLRRAVREKQRQIQSVSTRFDVPTTSPRISPSRSPTYPRARSRPSIARATCLPELPEASASSTATRFAFYCFGFSDRASPSVGFALGARAHRERGRTGRCIGSDLRPRRVAVAHPRTENAAVSWQSRPGRDDR